MTLNGTSMDLLRQLHTIWEDYREFMRHKSGSEYTSPINDECLLQIALEDEISKMQSLMKKSRNNNI